ncbi:hypothetical protein [Neobacillus sp. D3-1R]|uniref:hypothetical protein n=1 Tax=Neobacillus sp. D3-1R TaxID=3445778 RepID=UPI003FA13D16
MSTSGMLGVGNWIGILTTCLIILCFYFTLTFFEQLRKGEERIIKQSKIAATICFTLAFIIPAIYKYYIYQQMMK